MAALLTTTLAANKASPQIIAAAENGAVVVHTDGTQKLRIEGHLNPTGPVWGVLFEGETTCVVQDYVGTGLRFTNLGGVAMAINVGQK